MKLINTLVAMFFLAIPLAARAAEPEPEHKSDMTLWYAKPAEKWLDAAPLGNGYMGAMVFGGVEKERIALNESSFWSGKPHDYDNPEAGKYFAPIKELMFADKFQEAEKLVDSHFFGIPAAQQAFEPLGDLNLTFTDATNPTDYRRELNMATGVAKVTFKSADVTYTREIFISYPDRVLICRLTADKPGKISVKAQVKSPWSDQTVATKEQLSLDGSWKAGVQPKHDLIGKAEGDGLKFRVSLTAKVEGGKAEAKKSDESSYNIEDADSVTFILTAATSYVNYNDISVKPAERCEKILTAAGKKDYAALLKDHVADFSALMSRVHLTLGDARQNEKPIDERLKAYRAGARDTNLEALTFQLGRYILAASSRAGGQPANLQGIWNQDLSPNWGSKYTININTEMNYWPAEIANLGETAQPVFDMLADNAITGAKTAKVYYGINEGWVTHHNIDLWRGAAPVDAARFGMWPMGGAWMCQAIWEHYAYSGDLEFLKKQYPTMKGAAQFLSALLVEHPKYHFLVTPFSMSPEHGFIDNAGKPAVLNPAPTMDIAIIRELFSHVIESARLLNTDKELADKLAEQLKKLPPYKIGASGFVQEWIEDYKSGGQGHNVSPNFAFFPGQSLQLRRDPEFATAYQKWLDAHPGRGGFIVSWDIAMWARLERGDKVGEFLQAYMNRGPANNLHNAGSNQSDASFGFTAALAEALVQSHAGEIALLPALPAGWTEGSITGLRARGGFTVDIAWKENKLDRAILRSTFAVPSQIVRYGGKTLTIPTIKASEAVFITSDFQTLRLTGSP